tara:strand:- start:343 stop:630 length:288 start_codon:yes stop_codon:yes gene_type:complete
VIRSNFKKIEISKNLNEEIGLSLNYSKKITNDLIEILIDEIKKGELNLKNIGKFRLLQKKNRIGRNPKTKEVHLIHSRKSISFLPSKNLLNKLND